MRGLMGRILASVGLVVDPVRTPQTLAAAQARWREALADAETVVAALAQAERGADTPAAAELRAERLRIDGATQRMRLRMELFRSDRLATGATYVTAASSSRTGDTLSSLVAETADLARTVATARRRLGEIDAC